MTTLLPDRRPFGRIALAVVLCLGTAQAALADAAMEARIAALVPEIEAQVARGMAGFDAPGVAVGIVSGDRLVWGKGFGTGSKGGAPVDTRTVFQIGSTTKAFLATTLALAVDRGKLAWDDRVVDHYPGFQMMDPWVTQEFRIFDLLAQRSGLPAYANDEMGIFGFSTEALIRSLRDVEPVSSFRSTFAYTNVTHLLASEIVAEALDAPDWASVVQTEIFAPLGMTRSSLTDTAIETADNTTIGHLYAPGGSTEIPFSPLFPYAFEGAGAINSTIDDLVPWVRLQLGNGTIDGKELVSAENIAATRVPRIGMSPVLSYAMGWVQAVTPGGQITWHNGSTTGYGTYIGLVPDHDLAVIVLTNLTNVGLPDALGFWTLNKLLGNPEVDYLTHALEAAKTGAEQAEASFAVPAGAVPPPDLAALSGSYAGAGMGDIAVAAEGAGLMATITETGARLQLSPWNGPVMTARLVPEGRFATIAANLGPDPMAFVQFTAGLDGRIGGMELLLSESAQVKRLARK